MGKPARLGGQAAGFTVLELLIASAVFVLVVGALAAYFATSTKGMQAMESISNRQQELEAAVNVMSYDVALSGYKGTTPDDVARTFGGSTLLVEKGVGPADSDRLRIQYFEDTSRLFGGANTCGSPCVVTYEVDEEDGRLNLYRQEGDAPERGIVQEVEHFKVIQFILRDGTQVDITSTATAPSELAALNIEIAFSTGGLWRFPIGVSNKQE